MTRAARYRHELKYRISYGDYLALRQRLRPLMTADKHGDADGRYQIRSIYFDNFADKAYREKVNGVSQREKFRLRYYNDDLAFISLEKKIKQNNLCMKFTAPLSEDECRRLLTGDTDWMLGHDAPLVRELYGKMRGELLRPRVVVSYLREPYLFPAGNVRVTFDSQLRTSLCHPCFLPPEVRDISAVDKPGQIIMEVKYDSFLPEVIAQLLQTGHLRQQAFSKYGVSRRFG